jgi:phage terminase large subunit-like protein
MNDFEDELLSYPWSGGHDDQVDVLSMASIVAGGGDQLTGDSIKVIGGGESGGGGWTRVSG